MHVVIGRCEDELARRGDPQHQTAQMRTGMRCIKWLTRLPWWAAQPCLPQHPELPLPVCSSGINHPMRRQLGPRLRASDPRYLSV